MFCCDLVLHFAISNISLQPRFAFLQVLPPLPMPAVAGRPWLCTVLSLPLCCDECYTANVSQGCRITPAVLSASYTRKLCYRQGDRTMRAI